MVTKWRVFYFQSQGDVTAKCDIKGNVKSIHCREWKRVMLTEVPIILYLTPSGTIKLDQSKAYIDYIDQCKY